MQTRDDANAVRCTIRFRETVNAAPGIGSGFQNLLSEHASGKQAQVRWT